MRKQKQIQMHFNYAGNKETMHALRSICIRYLVWHKASVNPGVPCTFLSMRPRPRKDHMNFSYRRPYKDFLNSNSFAATLSNGIWKVQHWLSSNLCNCDAVILTSWHFGRGSWLHKRCITSVVQLNETVVPSHDISEDTSHNKMRWIFNLKLQTVLLIA